MTKLALTGTVVCALAGAAAAAPTTAGVEAELVNHYVDLTDATALRAWGNPTYLDEGTREIGQRVVCSTARSTVDPDFPLVSLTYDMWSRSYVNGHLRRLELVTGPVVAADGAAWRTVREAIEDAYRTFAATCTAASYAYQPKSTLTSKPHCAVDVGALVAASNGKLTTKCHADATRDLKPAFADKVRIAARLDEQGRLPVRTGFEGAGIQVSLGIDLADFARLDLSRLFDGGKAANLAYELLRRDQAWKALADRGFTDEQAGFVAVQHAAFHAYLLYFHGKFKEIESELWKVIDAHTITDEGDYKLKNAFTLFPKAGLDVLYARLVERDPAFAERFAGLGAHRACAHELAFKAYLSTEIDEDRQDECPGVYERAWVPAITGKRDPLGLSAIANPIAPREVEGKLRAVFELRGTATHAMRTSRALKVVVDDPKLVELEWNADFPVSEGLP